MLLSKAKIIIFSLEIVKFVTKLEILVGLLKIKVEFGIHINLVKLQVLVNDDMI